MPDTKPGITLDEKGWCNACRSSEMKKSVDWAGRKSELDAIVKKIKSDNYPFYDCIVPVSGGKNSWYQTWTMAKKYNLKVLCVMLAAHLPTTEGIHNINMMVKQLNVDLITVTLKPSVYKGIRRKCFIKQGEPNWAEHCAVFSGVVNIALIYNVPLIVWGEDIAFEFGGSQTKNSKPSAIDIDKNDLIKGKTILDWLDNNIEERDVFFYKYPEHAALKQSNIKSIYLGHFDCWDGRKHYEFAKSMGFTERINGPLSGNYIDYDNIDEKLCEINIWLKYLKFGFWRPTDQTCYDIWNYRLNREEAVIIVNKLQDEFPKEYFKDFLRFHNLSELEFYDIVERFRNTDIWEKKDKKWKLKNNLE